MNPQHALHDHTHRWDSSAPRRARRSFVPETTPPWGFPRKTWRSTAACLVPAEHWWTCVWACLMLLLVFPLLCLCVRARVLPFLFLLCSISTAIELNTLQQLHIHACKEWNIRIVLYPAHTLRRNWYSLSGENAVCASKTRFMPLLSKMSSKESGCSISVLVPLP